MTKSSGLESKNETPITKMGNVLLRLSLKYMPDASIFAVALTFIAFGLGIALTDQGPMQMVQNWYKGFWELLGFSMQMALIVISSGNLDYCRKVYFNNKYMPTLFINDDKLKSKTDQYVIND